jgi:Reverse transcriptase (RNA-dependent DNA polymerase)
MALSSCDPDHQTFEDLHPLLLQAKVNAEDNPTWDEAMNGPLRDGYWKAAEKELQTLEAMDVWDVVDREPWMNVLPSTWAFKCKRFPSGEVWKLKARFCCRGDRQIDGIDFDSDNIFSPVVNWNTVRLILILSLILGLESKQVDYTAAFVHAPIGDKQVFVAMPRGFSEPGKVLKLKKSLYSL